MSLTTPEKTRTLQRKLYRKAKEKKPPRRGRLRPELFSVCLTMKLVGKPDAGNRHVRFDERGQETECCHMAQATAPVLDSTDAARRKAIVLALGHVASPPRTALQRHLAEQADPARKLAWLLTVRRRATFA